MTVMWLSCDFTDTPPRQASGRTEEETVPVEARGNEKRERLERGERGREGGKERREIEHCLIGGGKWDFLPCSLTNFSFKLSTSKFYNYCK